MEQKSQYKLNQRRKKLMFKDQRGKKLKILISWFELYIVKLYIKNNEDFTKKWVKIILYSTLFNIKTSTKDSIFTWK